MSPFWVSPSTLGQREVFRQPVGKGPAMKYGNLTLGQIEALVTKLGGENVVKDILSDTVELGMIHSIDSDDLPIPPNGYQVKEHEKQGILKIIRKGDDL